MSLDLLGSVLGFRGISSCYVSDCTGRRSPRSKPKAKPTREQVQTEIDLILREAEQKRLKRSEEERQMRVFKAAHEDTLPESHVGLLRV